MLVLFQSAVLIFSVIVHEVAHGLMALHLGDETAKRAGRLTLNPVSHIDLMGTIILPLIMALAQSPVMFGWAKPVPYNPMALYKDFRYGPLKVALAGPLSNLALALVFGLIIRLFGGLMSPALAQSFFIIVLINVLLCIFNLIPIPPLDGSKILTTFLPRASAVRLETLGFGGMIIVFGVLFFFASYIQKAAFFLSLLIIGG